MPSLSIFAHNYAEEHKQFNKTMKRKKSEKQEKDKKSTLLLFILRATFSNCFYQFLEFTFCFSYWALCLFLNLFFSFFFPPYIGLEVILSITLVVILEI